MIDFEHDKPFIIGAAALIGVTVLFSLSKKNKVTSDVQGSTAEPVFGNDTLYIPTNSYDIHYVAGNETVTQATTTNSATNGGIVNPPVITKPADPVPASPKVPDVHIPKGETPKIINAPSVVTYTVKKGDTLWSIAKAQTGNGKNYVQIAKDNKIKDPNKLTIGQKLKITK
jgi:LysM repeat protein